MAARDRESHRNSGANSDFAGVAGRSEPDPVCRNPNSRTILGINFFAGKAREAVELGLKGGLVVAPAAPALVNLPQDAQYRLAVSSADVAITDSSLMVILWNLTRRDNIPRVSGLEYLTLLLDAFRSANRELPFFIMPSKAAALRTQNWLKRQGNPCAESHCYVAPLYQTTEIEDSDLLQLLEELKPAHVIIGLGGGTQEKLGLFLRKRLSYRPGIHCIGAAIGFLTGDQVRIPMWADRLYLGWLFRCLDKPGSYIPRYWRARKLFWQLIFDKKATGRANTSSNGPGNHDEAVKSRELQTANSTTGEDLYLQQKSRTVERPPKSQPVGI